MDLDAARAALADTRFSRLDWVAATGSTNSDLVAAARIHSGDRVLVADHQDAGRGRLDRRWVAPPGSALALSVVVDGPLPQTGPHLVPMALAVATRDALEALSGAAVGLKWPNDLVVAAPENEVRKLGGVLSEFVTGHQRAVPTASSAVVVGVGVNFDWPEGFPPELAATATALNLLGTVPDRHELVVEVLRRFERRLDGLADSARACVDVLDAYRSGCVTIGRRVRVERVGEDIVGLATGLSSSGALVLVDDTDVVHEVTLGDVVHLRSA